MAIGSLAATSRGFAQGELAIGLALMGLLAAGIYAPLRVQHGGGATGFTLDDGVVLAMLFSLPAGVVPLAVAGATAVAHLSRGAEPLKVAYNASNRGLSATAATLVFWVLEPGPAVLGPRSLVVAVAAVAAYNLVNLTLQSQLRRRLTGASFTSTWAALFRLNAITSAANTAYGLLLAFVASQDLIATLLAGVLMVGMYLGYRGYAAMLEERQRAERLHALTRTLIDVTSSDESMRVFLQDLRSVTGAEGAALVLIDATGGRRLIRDGTAGSSAAGDLVDPFLEAVLSRTSPLLVSVPDPDAAHRDAIAAPVTYEGRTVGAIAVYDRYGLEPWDETHATLLGTIANEAAVALKNVELFAAVERERALLAEESRKLSDIVNNASDGIAMVEADGRIAAWNDAMSSITGLEAQDTFGQPWFTALRLRDASGVDLVPEGRNALAAALRGEGGSEDVQLQILRRDGQWRWIRCSLSPIERGGRGVVGAVLLVRDVTREHEVEELKSDFVATVSHELRTPLTPLRGFLDTLIAKGDRIDAEQTASILGSMRGQVQRLERLVGDLLVVADVDRHELGLRLEATELAALVPEAVSRIQPPIAEGRLTIGRYDPVSAVADPAAVVRVVAALVDNAAKHTDGPIHVRTYRAGDRAVVEVRDEGPGIAPWDHDLVFRRFGRLGNHLHRTQGPGLGLPIARALARSIDGDVTLESDVGHGATFRLELPVSVPRPAPVDVADQHSSTA